LPQDRQEYFRQYRQKHKAKLLQRSKEHYERNKKKRLLYQRKYYIVHKEMILAKAKIQSTEFIGHAQAIHKAVVKYAKEWKLPYSEWNEFKEWTIDDPKYEEIFKDWKVNLFDVQFSPVAMRLVKKNGFVVGNLQWKRKGDYSWWSEDRVLIQQIEKNLNEEQKVLNKRDKTWQEKTKEQIKNLKKKKK
jgi:hypothetical protein